MATSRSAANSLLIVSAWDPELEHLRTLLKAAPAVARRTSLQAVGIGLVQAGIGAASVLAERTNPPRALVFLGTAGVYPGADKRLVPGTLAVARAVSLLSSAVARKKAYFPGPMATTFATTPTLRGSLERSSGAHAADVACPLAITSSMAAARQAARRSGCVLENLELFSVGRACAGACIPFGAIVGIANKVGPHAHKQWKATADQVMARAADAAFAWLARGRF